MHLITKTLIAACVSLLALAATAQEAVLRKNLGDRSYAAFLGAGANTQRSVPRDDQRYFGISARLDF